ncbi:hypothetical protein [Alsobacter sp. R-9]
MDARNDKGGSRTAAAVTRASAPRSRPRRPQDLAFLFRNPPLAPGESEAEWQALCDGLAEALAPATVIDWLRLRDVAVGVWESLRMQRYRDALLRLERSRSATQVLSSLLAGRIEDPAAREKAAQSIARGWIAGRPGEKREVSQALASAGLDEEAIMAGAFLAHLETHERLERLRRRAEDARDAAMASFGPARPMQTARRDDPTELVIEAEVVTAEEPARPPKRPASRKMAQPPADEPVRRAAPPADPQQDLFG